MRPPRRKLAWRITHGSQQTSARLCWCGGRHSPAASPGSFNRLGPWRNPAGVGHDRSGLSLGLSFRSHPSLNLDRRAPAFPTAGSVSSPSNRPYGGLGCHRAAGCPSDRPATPPRSSPGQSPDRGVELHPVRPGEHLRPGACRTGSSGCIALPARDDGGLSCAACPGLPDSHLLRTLASWSLNLACLCPRCSWPRAIPAVAPGISRAFIRDGRRARCGEFLFCSGYSDF
jgi:hypothetical protein